MTKIRGSGRGHKVLVMLLVAALMFASTISKSHGRPLSSEVAQEEQEEEEEEEEQKAVLELSSRDDMVRMAGYGEDKLSTVIITGMVVCDRACLKASHGHLHQLPPHPVSGVLLAATCQTNDTEKLPINRAKAVSDKYGEFIIDLPSQLHAIQNLEKACSVKVLQLPNNSPCRQSDIARKHKGIRLSSADNGIRTFAAETVTLQGTIPNDPKACDKVMDDDRKTSW